ncbi:MAG: hypothetical protein AMS16_07460 [Planctomycetes bacterium DG_58]|nr:MAG: hypothetical protein AMS16_07460 [Planctomycetes bacterium DG_58]
MGSKALRVLMLSGFVLLLSGAYVPLVGQEKKFTATATFQKGVNGYSDASDDSRRPGKMKLVDDVKRKLSGWYEKQIQLGKMKREVVLENLSNYRHVLRWDHLDRWIKGENVKVLSAKVHIFYVDEFWSFYDYAVALHRSLDGTKDNTEKEPAATAHIFGERRGRGVATPFRSWIEFELRPEVIQTWMDDPKNNQGLVLLQQWKKDPPGKKSTGGFVVFASNTDGMTHLRPKLTITYEATGNVAPFAPVLLDRFDGIVVGTEHVLRWGVPEPPDVNRDKITFEIEYSSAEGGAWRPVAKGIPGEQRQFAWNTAAVPAGKGYRIRIRSVDEDAASSSWTMSEGGFTVVRRELPFQVGIETPLVKLRREGPYGGPVSSAAAVELARNEYEGFQIVLFGANREITGVKVVASDLKAEGAPGVIAARNVTVNPVGYVNTRPPSYTVRWVGQWPDSLLNVEKVDVPPGKVQPIWVTVYAPKGVPAGRYAGTLTITGDGIAPQTVALTARVFDFELPVRPTFQAFALGNIPKPDFYGLERGEEYDEMRKKWYDFLCRRRLPPGGFVLNAWPWTKPSYPAKVNPDGSYDFSEVDRWGSYCFDRGMNAFVAAAFRKPGKWGFPKTFSEQYYQEFTRFMTAYTTFLRKKGWLKDAVVYNIDEAPKAHWEFCKENYRRTKAVSPDLSVFQCLNAPKGVKALEGFFDVVDVNIGQFHQGGAPDRLKAGGRVWWCVCCWPSIGWLSWKLNIEGFEYWSVSSWSRCLTTMDGKKFVDQVESKWNANSFGKYNGDGYLTYPGPNNTLLSSIRFEALRDGFEDHEYLAVLKRRLAGKQGAAAAEARKLLTIDDRLCKRDLSYTRDPKVIFETRRRIAEAIEKLGR